MSAADCTGSYGGVYMGDFTSCGSNTCDSYTTTTTTTTTPAPTGACCSYMGDGYCTENVDQMSCSGYWYQGQTCAQACPTTTSTTGGPGGCGTCQYYSMDGVNWYESSNYCTGMCHCYGPTRAPNFIGDEQVTDCGP